MPPAPTESGEVDLGPITLHYRCWGDPTGRPVVLLHGGGSDGRTWATLAAVLATRGRWAVAPDLRGHGRSSRADSYRLADHAADALGLLDALGLPSVALVGHSLGAHAASLVAAERPQRVQRLVLEEPPAPNPVPGGPPGAGLSRPRMLLLAAGTLTRRRRCDPAALSAAVDELRTPTPDWWTGLARVTAPTLVVSGGPRSHVQVDRLAEVVRALPDARLETIPVGHRVHSLAPDRFVPLVSDFLTG